MHEDSAGLLDRLYGWVTGFAEQKASAEAFFEEHQALREEVLLFGQKLEETETLRVEVPDELYVAAANMMEVLDLLWDEAAGETVDLAEPAELLTQTRAIFDLTLPLLEVAVEELSQDNSGVDI